ncbi:MAG: VWA domain-containing protein [Candidatus Aminicenantales bacterium]
MRKIISLFIILFLNSFLFPQEKIFVEQATVINVEVPVRVFDRGKFVDNLSLEDFEVFEEGIPQKVVAVYLVKKDTITRKKEKKKFRPETSRNFYLLFQITEYSPRIEEALNYFIRKVLIPGDNLVVATPTKTYGMNERALELKSREEIIEELKELIRKDVLKGNSEYKASFENLKKITAALTSAIGEKIGDETRAQLWLEEFAAEYKNLGYTIDDTIDLLIAMYKGVLENLQRMRYVSQFKLMDFANFLKDKQGQKFVFLFYQREFIPEIEQGLLTQVSGEFQESQYVFHNLTDLFNMFKKEIYIDVDQVKQAYANSSASIHFMFFTKPAHNAPGIHFIEHSEDIYAAFKEMAKATGGTTESSSNPGFLFKKAVESSENYYLLYYSPQNYVRDGKFKKIEVRVKNKNYRILHRAGYFAD